MEDDGYISADAWVKGIAYYIASSIIGSASKLVIRKSWLIVNEIKPEGDGYASQEIEDDDSDEVASLSSPYELDEGEDKELESAPLHRRNSIGSFGEQSKEGEQFLGQGSNHITVVNNETKRIWKKELVARCYWYLGVLGMTIVDPILIVISMYYTTPSTLAPLSGLSLVWIILFSESLTSEKPQKKQIIAAGLIILGQIIVSIFGDHTNDDAITLQDM